MKLTLAGFEKVRSASDELRAVPEINARAAYRALNAVGAKIMTQARRAIVAEVNLTSTYVGEQMSLSKASMKRQEAVVRVRVRPVRLARFGARQLTAATKQAKRSRGDALRGIRKGRKSAGVSVKVKRGGSRKAMPGAFLVPLRAGKTDGGNGMGVFFRTGSGRNDIEHAYSASPDQLFSSWRDKNLENIQQQLADAYRSQLRFELTGSRK